MAGRFAETFMKQLRTAEQTGDPGPLAALFSAEAELTNLARPGPAHGPEGARKFWGDYLAAFKSIRSEFHHVIEGDGGIVLEWESSGELPNGHPIAYRGVSVLEASGDKVAKFRTYYDTAVFVTKPADAA